VLLPINTNELLTGAAIFVRVTGIIALLPIFGEGSVPVRIRIFLSIALAIGMFSTVPYQYTSTIALQLADPVVFAFTVAKELLIGVVIGFSSKLAFDGIVMAAGIISVQMGFSTSAIFMPGSDMESNGFSALHRIIVILVFLSLNLHFMYLASIAESFRLIPIGFAWPSGGLIEMLVISSGGIFVTALQLAAPLLVGLLFATAALGVISRTVPQANVFVMSFPVSFFVGLLLYMAILPLFPGWLSEYFSAKHVEVLAAIKGLTHAVR
jgi:flagellar biosynthetic protein FliR